MEKVQYLPERINITDHSNSQANFLVPSIECDNSAHKDTSLPSCLDSKSTYSNASSREELTEDDAPGKNADSRIVPVATFGNHHRGFHSYTNGLNGSRCLVPTPSDHVLSLLQSSISLQNSSSVALAEPRWNTAKIFDSRSERDNAAIINQRDAGFKDLRFPDLFRYGVRYVPNDGERNVYLTVKIARLPVDITLIAVTNKVRGGMLVDVKLLYTAAITGTKTCLITFFQEDAALNFEEHCSRYSIIFNGVVAHVEAIS